MKTKYFLGAALMTMALFSSCSNSTNGPNVGQTGTLKLTVTGGAVSRATGTLPTQTDENEVSRVAIGLFDHSSHSTTLITEGTLAVDGTITIGSVPTPTTQDIIVVANAPSGAFKGVTTADAFRAKTLTLAQTANNLPMSGENVSGVTLTAGATATASVTISRLVARVQLSSLSTNFSPVGLYANAKFSVDKIFLYNAASTSAVGIVLPATQLVTTDLIHGWDGTKTSTGATGLIDALSPAQDITSTAYTTPYYYYTFENYYSTGITSTSKTTATKLVIGGYFYPDAVNAPTTKTYVYYPAVINRSQTGTVITAVDGSSQPASVSNTGIQRNNIYSVAATIQSIGVDSPDKFMEPAALTLTVTVAPWNLTVSQTVNF